VRVALYGYAIACWPEMAVGAVGRGAGRAGSVAWPGSARRIFCSPGQLGVARADPDADSGESQDSFFLIVTPNMKFPAVPRCGWWLSWPFIAFCGRCLHPIGVFMWRVCVLTEG